MSTKEQSVKLYYSKNIQPVPHITMEINKYANVNDECRL